MGASRGAVVLTAPPFLRINPDKARVTLVDAHILELDCLCEHPVLLGKRSRNVSGDTSQEDKAQRDAYTEPLLTPDLHYCVDQEETD